MTSTRSSPASTPRAADRRAPRGAQGRTRREGRGGASRPKQTIADEAEKLATRQRLAQRRQPAARPARDVEVASPDRQGERRRAVAPVLVGPDDVHPAAQAALRRAQREARRRSGRQGEAGRRGRGAGRLDRLGRDGACLPRPDDAVEGGRPGAEGRRRRAVEAVPDRAGHVLRRPRRRRTPSSTRSTPPTPR